MKVTLENGVEFEGTAQEISEYLALVERGNGKFYKSESRGLILISEMDTTHIKNALLKKVRKWEKSLHSVDLEDFLDAMHQGLWQEGDDEFDNLVEELTSR